MKWLQSKGGGGKESSASFLSQFLVPKQVAMSSGGLFPWLLSARVRAFTSNLKTNSDIFPPTKIKAPSCFTSSENLAQHANVLSSWLSPSSSTNKTPHGRGLSCQFWWHATPASPGSACSWSASPPVIAVLGTLELFGGVKRLGWAWPHLCFKISKYGVCSMGKWSQRELHLSCMLLFFLLLKCNPLWSGNLWQQDEDASLSLCQHPVDQFNLPWPHMKGKKHISGAFCLRGSSLLLPIPQSNQRRVFPWVMPTQQFPNLGISSSIRRSHLYKHRKLLKEEHNIPSCWSKYYNLMQPTELNVVMNFTTGTTLGM